MSNEKKSEWQKWQEQNIRTGKDQVIFRFLSNLSDHHGKNTFWLRSQFPLYKRKFFNIPKDYLTKAFFDYLMNTMPSWLPTLPQVAEKIYDRDDLSDTGTQSNWILISVKIAEQTETEKKAASDTYFIMDSFPVKTELTSTDALPIVIVNLARKTPARRCMIH